MALVDYGSDNAAGIILNEPADWNHQRDCTPSNAQAHCTGDTSEEDSASVSQDSYFDQSDSDR